MSKVILRVLVSICGLFAVSIFSFWISIPLFVLALFAFRNFFEGVLWFLIIFHLLMENSFSSGRYFFFNIVVISCGLMILSAVEKIKERINFFEYQR